MRSTIRAEAEPRAVARYCLPGGMIELADGRQYRRTLLGAPVWLGLLPLLGRGLARLGRRRAQHALERWWACTLRRFLGVRLEIDGLEHICRSEAYIVVPLHEGLADVLALLHLPLDLRFVVRDELFGWRWLGGYLRDTGQIEVSPERGLWSYRQVLRAAGTVLAAGESLVIFPQGTILGIETDCTLGAFALAHTVGRPILPVALTGSHRVWEHPYTPRLRYGQRLSLRVLAPVPADAVRASQPEHLRRAIQAQLKAAALSGTMAPPRRFVPARDGYWDGYAYRIDPAFGDLAADVARHRQARPGAAQDEVAALAATRQAGSPRPAPTRGAAASDTPDSAAV